MIVQPVAVVAGGVSGVTLVAHSVKSAQWGRVLAATPRFECQEGLVAKVVQMHNFVRLLLVAGPLALIAGCAGSPPRTLACDSQKHSLRFKLEDDGCVKRVTNGWGSDREKIEVCHGDTITWKVRKSTHPKGDLKKGIAFDRAQGSPLQWQDSGFQADKIVGQVRNDAATGEPGFKYTVSTERGPGNVCEHDPMIIVRPR
jgi:hypothetical protein